MTSPATQQPDDEAVFLVLDLTTQTVLGYATTRKKALRFLSLKAKEHPKQTFALVRVEALVYPISEVH